MNPDHYYLKHLFYREEIVFEILKDNPEVLKRILAFADVNTEDDSIK